MKNSLFILPIMLITLMLLLVSCDKDDDTQPPVSNTPEETLSLALERIIDETEVPGFAISIVKDNVISYQEAFGYADLQTQRPYSNQTVQHIASTSKTFVGAAVIKAIEQGYFTLETPINDLLPVELNNPKHPDLPIKIKHLVTHTSGLLDNPALYFPTNYYILAGEDLSTQGAQLLGGLGIEQRAGQELEELLVEYFLEDGDFYTLDNFADTAPGSTWAYSNMATGLMSYLIETVSGQSFADYTKTQILQPLDMNQSTYDITETNLSEMASWYYDKNTPFPLYANDSYAEGSLFTHNEDLGKYLLDMVKGRQGLSTRLFSTDGYETLFTPQLANGVVPTDFAENHGIFWIKSGNKMQHGGNSFGVSTYLEISTTEPSGYSLMTNLDAVLDASKYSEAAQRIDQAVQQFIQAN